MHRSPYCEKHSDQRVQCNLCAHRCMIEEGSRGNCGVRLNYHGELYSLVYGQTYSVNIDPIEKKPLFHFLPGTNSLSLGTVGCNFHCSFCQNWELSQACLERDPREIRYMELSPEGIVDHCVQRGIASVSFTYNEPTVFFEYALETARLAHDNGIRTAFVSNGYQTRQAIETIAPWLDAINIDLKSFRDEFYREYCGARLAPVLDTIRHAHELGIWVEATTLLIPELNDTDAELSACAGFLAAIDPSLPWHITAFHPDHCLTDHPHTQPEALYRACELGRQAGLHYVYTGNIIEAGEAATRCPSCSNILVTRDHLHVQPGGLEQGTCNQCGQLIAGVWQ